MKITLISTSTTSSDQGLRTISSNLKKQGKEVKILFLPLGTDDYNKLYSKNVITQVLNETKDSNLIGINSMASTSKRAEQLIKILKENKLVVYGGHHPTFFPERCFKIADIVVRGEAEEAFLELVNNLKNKKDITEIKNLYVRKDNKEYRNEVRPYNQNLDDLEKPDYDIEDHKILENNKLIPFQERHFNGVIFFQTARGCPHACSYCTNTIMRELYKGKGKCLRSHSVDYVITELKRLKNKFKTIGVFDIRDETFTVRELNWIKEFSKRYKNEINVRFKCLADPATMGTGKEAINEEKIKLLVDAGLRDIIIGIQSGSDRINFDVYNRYIKAEELLKCAKVVNKFKELNVMYDIMTSNPYETKEDLIQTIKLIIEIPPPYYLSVNNLIFFEGTPLYKKAKEDGIIKEEKDSASTLNYWDRWAHIKLKKKNQYLTLVLNLMRGTANKNRIGMFSRSTLNTLIKEDFVNFNYKHLGLTKTFGTFVSLMDFTREHVMKPIYHSTPTSFKVWYDKRRYKA
ncbi:MAG: B12-binding domain-containing radical SAM protein [Nanoarchaeota archaeon]|nr:B12-binding domain-containing radical SAM protein [Nanoarchaeota archaeon]